MSSQQADEAKRVAENKASVDKATAATAEHANKSARERENVSANSWHEYWVTNVVPQPTRDDYDNHAPLRTGAPGAEEAANAKANGKSESE